MRKAVENPLTSFSQDPVPSFYRPLPCTPTHEALQVCMPIGGLEELRWPRHYCWQTTGTRAALNDSDPVTLQGSPGLRFEAIELQPSDPLHMRLGRSYQTRKGALKNADATVNVCRWPVLDGLYAL